MRTPNKDDARADAAALRQANEEQRKLWKAQILAEHGPDYLAEVEAFIALLDRASKNKYLTRIEPKG